jgi:hypothetical protein
MRPVPMNDPERPTAPVRGWAKTDVGNGFMEAGCAAAGDILREV